MSSERRLETVQPSIPAGCVSRIGSTELEEYSGGQGTVLTPGEKLDLGLARDQSWRDERRAALQRSIRCADALLNLGRNGCVAAGLILPAYWIIAFATIYASYFADAPSAVWLLGFMLAMGLFASVVLALGAHTWRQGLYTHAEEHEIGPLHTGESSSSLPPELQEQLRRESRRERHFSNLCVAYGVLTLALWLTELGSAILPEFFGFLDSFPKIVSWAFHLPLPVSAAISVRAGLARRSLLRSNRPETGHDMHDVDTTDTA